MDHRCSLYAAPTGTGPTAERCLPVPPDVEPRYRMYFLQGAWPTRDTGKASNLR